MRHGQQRFATCVYGAIAAEHPELSLVGSNSTHQLMASKPQSVDPENVMMHGLSSLVDDDEPLSWDETYAIPRPMLSNATRMTAIPGPIRSRTSSLIPKNSPTGASSIAVTKPHVTVESDRWSGCCVEAESSSSGRRLSRTMRAVNSSSSLFIATLCCRDVLSVGGDPYGPVADTYDRDVLVGAGLDRALARPSLAADREATAVVDPRPRATVVAAFAPKPI